MAEKNHRLLLGAHMSIAGGLYKALERGASIGCSTIQIFTKSNRQWKAKPLSDSEIEQYKQAVNHFQINPVVAHAAYLINIAATDKEILKKSIESLVLEISRCDQLTIPYLILHPGVNKDEKQGILNIAQSIDEIYSKQNHKTTLLLEAMAGQGSGLGRSFEQLAEIYRHIHHKSKVGFCIDTCHIFAAGYDISSEKTYESTWKHFDKILGFEKLKAIHVNDSKKKVGSHVDRHEDIGKGEIGLEGFSFLFNDKRFIDIPKILETPNPTLDSYLMNMKTIEKLISPSLKKKLVISIR